MIIPLPRISLTQGAIAALVLALGVQTWRLDSWRGQAKAEQAAHVQTVANYRAAQREAEAAALAQKQAVEARYNKLAKEADHAHQADLADARSDTARYIAGNRVRPQAAAGACSPTAAAADDHGARGAEAPGAGAVMVSEHDLGILVENTFRLKAAVEWAKGLTGNY